MIELGRYIVGECGVYVTRVVDRKVSRGRTYLVVDGGMHHQLAASGNFGQAIRRNYPIAVGNRLAEPAESAATVVGCLCTPLDLLGDDVRLAGCPNRGFHRVVSGGRLRLDRQPHGLSGPSATR